MPEDNREDIRSSGRSYMTISLLPEKIRVLIIGGGRAGFIKARAFLEKGCSVCILSKYFIDEFEWLKHKENAEIINGSYDKSYIAYNHIVVIASDDKKLNESIKADCEAQYKIYLTCESFERGMFVTPVQGETEEIQFSVNTKHGSPKTSVLLRSMLKEYLEEFDGFVKYVCSLRENLKGSDKKDEIMAKVNTKEFYEQYKKGAHEGFIENTIDSM